MSPESSSIEQGRTIPKRSVKELERIIEEAAIALHIPDLEDIQRGSYSSRLYTLAKNLKVRGESVITSMPGPEGKLVRKREKIINGADQRRVLLAAVTQWRSQHKNMPEDQKVATQKIRDAWMKEIDALLPRSENT